MTEQEIKHKNASKTVREVLRAMPDGHQFYGWELKDECVKRCPDLKNMYVDSFLRKLRRCKTQYVCVDHQKSIYMKVCPDDADNN